MFGEEIDASKFPRTLDQITAEPELIVLRQQIEKSNVGTGLIDAIEETKVARLLELENNFVNKIKKKDYGIEATIVDGILSVNIPYKEETKSHKVKVKVG